MSSALDAGIDADRPRSAGWVVVPACAFAVAVSVLAIAPVSALGLEWLREVDGSPSGSGEALALPSPIPLLLRSASVAVAVAIVATMLVWPAARRARARRDAEWRERSTPAARAGRGLLAVLCACIVLPIALPPWILYAAIWMSTGPGTLVGDFAERNDLVSWQRLAIMAVSLVAWAGAPAFVVLAAVRPATRDASLLALDGAGRWARVRSAFARDSMALLVSVVSLSAFLLGETTVFDLAQFSSYGYELRTLDSIGAPASTVFAAGLPSVMLVAGIACVLPFLAARLRGARAETRGCGDRPEYTPTAPLGARRAWAFGVGGTSPIALAAIPAIVVVALLLRIAFSIPRAGDFWGQHGDALLASVLIAVCAAAVAAVIAALASLLLAVCSAWRGSIARSMLVGSLLMLLLAGLVPGTLAALSIVAFLNTPFLGGIYDSPLVVVFVLVMRALPVAVIVAWGTHLLEPVSRPRLRSLDGTSLRAAWLGLMPRVRLAFVATAALAVPWSLGELTASSRLVPPGIPWLASDVLNAIHYQRPETVVLAVLGLICVALPAVVLLVRGLGVVGRPLRAPTMVALAALLVGCGGSESTVADASDDPVTAFLRSAAPEVRDALAVDATLEGVGRGKGQFNAPRVVATDPRSGAVYAIDKDARVQRFDRDGVVQAEWRMPKSDRGKPVGASVAPDGTLVVADTHEHRLVCYSPEGELLWTLGGYGTEAGQFIYPTDIAFLPDGRMLVAEYGGNDRIQAFDREHRFMYQFGRCGTADGEFLRPQALQYDAARDELFVADAGNHRIGVFTADGEWRRALGRPGAGAGEFRYPFGLLLLVDGHAVDALAEGAPASGRRTLVVAEQTNHRIQEVDASTGQPLGIGGGIGRGRGRLKYPWALAAAGIGDGGRQRLAVCEQGNSRIAFFTLPLGEVGGSDDPRGGEE